MSSVERATGTRSIKMRKRKRIASAVEEVY
jgi:hypothetical protein